jgi:hypothetical protein
VIGERKSQQYKGYEEDMAGFRRSTRKSTGAHNTCSGVEYDGYFALPGIFLPRRIMLGSNGVRFLSSQSWAGANVCLLTSAIWTAA